MALVVGVCGLGIMGTGMSANLLKHGFAVVGYDIDPERRDVLAGNGGAPLASNAEVGRAADVVLLSLPHADALVAVTEGDGGLQEARKDGLVALEMSTLSLRSKERARDALAAAGTTLLDAPVSGAGKQAQSGELSIMVSGDRAAYDRIAEIFPAFSTVHRHVGAFGVGIKLKLIINMMISIHGAAFAEAVALARKAGVDLDMLFDAVTAGAGNSRVVEYRGPMMVNRKFTDPEFQGVALTIQVKDNDVISNWIKTLHVPTPTFNASMPYYEAGLSMGFGEEDPAAIVKVAEAMSGVAVAD